MKVYSSGVAGNAPIYVGEGTRELLLEEIEKLAPDRVFVVTDRTVETLFVEELQENLPSSAPAEVIALNEGEANKNLANLEHVAGDLLRAGATDASLVLGVGGGLVLNMAGLAASLIGHGLRFAHVATTFNAGWQVTTSNRQAVHFVGRRNAFGVYRAPEFSIVDSIFLTEEPERQVKASLADFARQALVAGGAAFERAEETLAIAGDAARRMDALEACIEHALERGRADTQEREAAAREAYGTTAGRAIEIQSEGRLLAGEAHYYGARVASAAAHAIGVMPGAERARHDGLLDRLTIEAGVPEHLRTDHLVFQLHGNNKTQEDGLAFMLLEGVGRVAGGGNGLGSRIQITDAQAADAIDAARGR